MFRIPKQESGLGRADAAQLGEGGQGGEAPSHRRQEGDPGADGTVSGASRERTAEDGERNPKKPPSRIPPPICIETGSGYTGAAPGQWPFAFWRRFIPVKKPGPRDAADAAVVALRVTPFRKLI